MIISIWSRSRIMLAAQTDWPWRCGRSGPRGIRTPDLLVRSHIGKWLYDWGCGDFKNKKIANVALRAAWRFFKI